MAVIERHPHPKSVTNLRSSFRFCFCAVALTLTVAAVVGQYDLFRSAWLFDSSHSSSDRQTAAASVGSTADDDFHHHHHNPVTIPNFYEIAKRTGTDKVRGTSSFSDCQAYPETKCPRPDAFNPQCRVTGHFYDSLYQRWLAPLATVDTEFIFLEIGFYNGKGFDAFTELLPNAEKHSLEIACLEPGPRNEGKWPWGNFADHHPRYQELLDTKRLHCGDASEYKVLMDLWTEHLLRPDAPPLQVVVEDASHLSQHMAISVFFWFPRLAPGGMLFVEDMEPQTSANQFRKTVVPKLVRDVSYCGFPNERMDQSNALCYPTLQPYLKSIHCEMHICVLERNDHPAIQWDEYTQEQSMPPDNVYDMNAC